MSAKKILEPFVAIPRRREGPRPEEKLRFIEIERLNCLKNLKTYKADLERHVIAAQKLLDQKPVARKKARNTMTTTGAQDGNGIAAHHVLRYLEPILPLLTQVETQIDKALEEFHRPDPKIHDVLDAPDHSKKRKFSEE